MQLLQQLRATEIEKAIGQNPEVDFAPIIDRVKYMDNTARVESLQNEAPIRVAVTGAAGQIGYSLLFRIASGSMFGTKTPVILHLLELPQAQQALEGVVMELEDSAFPLVHGIVASTDPKEAFAGVDYALLVGSKPRGPGMERADLLKENANIFKIQGEALNAVGKGENTRVCVVGNPANTNALIAQQNAPNIPAENFSAMTRLDHNRGLSQLAEKLGVEGGEFERFVIWGNHSSTQVPDISHTYIASDSTKELIADKINDSNWVFKNFIPTVQKRGAAIIAARGASSAASAASSLVDHVRDLHFGTFGKWTSMAVVSNGEYGTTKGLFYSFPVKTREGRWGIVNDLPLTQEIADLMNATDKELAEEREAVKEFMP
eukprot:TRINITY_DN963_c0_g1_i2.p1 TRINITY_DN963_c0_g1~~TRINITY_DN963_c0_g1_i2.p1  ORF type:complete len:376 (-),score=124.38 TRINITY_DN963_c0_g1_i2:36-1163(-)